METIHSRLGRLRRQKGVSLEEVAKEIGVSWQTIQQWEKEDGTAPNRNRQKKVAEFYGITISELISGSSSVEPAIDAPIEPHRYAQVLADLDVLHEDDAAIWLAQIRAAANKIRRDLATAQTHQIEAPPIIPKARRRA
jgi:transcriptional regulator with XRE-family HTH domain